jgi:50S ribosomal protein L16 3-hydroxylase
LPEALLDFAESAVKSALKNPLAIACALGEIMTTPKAQIWFDEAGAPWNPASGAGLRLDAKSRMLYDANHVFLNGESYRAKGADAALMRRLADERELTRSALRKASQDALALLQDWQAAGWIHAVQE